MKVDSYGLSDKEFLSAVEMFVNDETQKYGFTLTNVNDSGSKGLFDLIKSIDESMDDEIIFSITSFRLNHLMTNSIWILHAEHEVCGIISFEDWQG